MEDIQKIEDVECDRDCSRSAVTKIETSDGVPLHLCVRHEEKFAEELREKIEGKYEGMSKEQIAKKMMQGEGLL